MKKIVFLIIISLLISCKKEKTTIDEKSSNSDFAEFRGSWVGYYQDSLPLKKDLEHQFAINFIEVSDKKVLAKIIYASAYVAPVFGKLIKNKNDYQFELKDTANATMSQIYVFKIKNNHLIGELRTKEASTKTQITKFNLQKRKFVYNVKNNLPKSPPTPKDDMPTYNYVDWLSKKVEKGKTVTDEDFMNYRQADEKIITSLNGSIEIFTEKQLKNLKKIDLEILKNTIYARHGFTFKKEIESQFFDKVSWYIPVYDKVEEKLSSLEKQNIKLLLKFEKYANDNYDYFGR